jgi:ADP-heptose:LPS heptosyltransferase
MPDLFPEFVLPADPVNTPIDRCDSSSGTVGPRILIMRLAAYGDILMATPMLAALRRAYPSAQITWIVERHQNDTIVANPHVDELLLWEGRYWKRLLRRGLFPLWLHSALKLRGELLKRRFDIFVSLQPEEWPLLTLSLPSAKKIGVFDTFKRFNRSTRTSSYVKYFTDPFTSNVLPVHRTDQYLLVLKALGLSESVSKQMYMGITDEADSVAYAHLVQAGWDGNRQTVVIAPQTTWPSRCWPTERYSAVANALANDDFQIVLIGSPKEQESIAKIRSTMARSPIVLDGNLSFLQVSAVIARASLVVSGDTGPMHVASALSVPHVAIFGPTSASWYGALSGNLVHLSHEVPCGPCDQKTCPLQGKPKMICMDLVTVDEVLSSSFKMLNDNVASG